MRSLVFLVISDDLDHLNIESRPIGGSEFQFYSLIHLLQKKYRITCYNKKKESVVLEQVLYKNFNELKTDDLAPDTSIIIGRFMPHTESVLFHKIKNNRMYLWWHDYVSQDSVSSRMPFLIDCSEESKQKYTRMNDKESFKNDILIPLTKTKQLQHVFNSTYSKRNTISLFSNFNLQLESHNQCHFIYNCLYSKQFIDFKRPSPDEINVNQIVFASAWTKGVSIILDLFQYISARDLNFQLVLMSPGYEWANVQNFVPSLKEKFGNRIIIHGPCDKKKYSEVISKSLCVMSGRFPETFGCVFAESYFLGTPVIADVQSGAVKEIIDPTFIVNYDDANEVFQKLVDLRSRRTKIHIDLRDEFREEHILQQWINLIKG